MTHGFHPTHAGKVGAIGTAVLMHSVGCIKVESVEPEYQAAGSPSRVKPAIVIKAHHENPCEDVDNVGKSPEAELWTIKTKRRADLGDRPNW